MAHKEGHSASSWEDEYLDPLTPDQELLDYILLMAPSSFGRIGEGIEVSCIAVSGISMNFEPLTLFLVVKFPSPWPIRVVDLITRDLVDGAIKVQAIPGNRVSISLIRRNDSREEIVESLQTPSLQGGESTRHLLCIQWDGKYLDIRIDGVPAGSGNPSVQLPPTLILGEADTTRATTAKVDFTTRNLDIRCRRRDSVANLQPRPGSKLKSKERDFRDLAREATLIRDSISRVHSGQVDHAVSIARSIRKLIIRASQQIGVFAALCRPNW